MTDHPRARLDDLIHQPVRFSMVAALAAADELEFGFVRDTIEVSASLLSRYVAQLEEAGYVTVRKGYVGKRPRTWLALSPAGRDAYRAHLEALREIAGDTLSARAPARAVPSRAAQAGGTATPRGAARRSR